MDKPRTPDIILASGIAGIIFIALFIVLDFGFVASLVVALVGFTAGAYFIRTKSDTVLERESTEQTLLKNGRLQRAIIAKLATKITTSTPRENAMKILENLDKILDTLSADPTKLHAALQFLDYYLNSTVKVITTYVALVEKGVHSADVAAAIAKAETTLGELADAFEAQLGKLLSKDANDLSVEIKVLEDNLKSDGLVGRQS
jgi:5-bromo-4-chloroindolyl phosphate hydrolysis protein